MTIVTSSEINAPAPSTPPPSQLARHWAHVTSGVASLQDLLRDELREAWRCLSALLDEQAQAASGTPDAADGLAEYAEARTVASRAALLDPLTQWERVRPLRRAQLAIESYHRGVDDLVRRLATTVETDGAELVAAVGPESASGLAGRVAGWRRAPRRLPLEAVVATAFRYLEAPQAVIESRYLMAVGRGEQQIRWQWNDARESLDDAVAGRDDVADEAGSPRDELELEVNAALSELDQWFPVVPAEIGRRLVSALAWGRTPPALGTNPELAAHLEHWDMQLASVESELRFERSLEGVERRILATGERACAGLEAERARLLEAIDGFVRWLDLQLQRSGSGESLPPVFADIVPAESRMTDFAAGVRTALDQLPDELELSRRLAAEPRSRRPMKVIAPDRMATEAFARVGKARIQAVFAGVQAEHVALVQQIERARQVVEFASEGEGGSEDADVAREALQNATSLLEVDRSTTPTMLVAERRAVAEALASVIVENRELLTRSRLGAFAHLGRMGLRHGVVAGSATVLASTLRGIRAAGSAALDLYRRFLVAIGWTPDSSTESQEVVRRPYLPREFTLDPREKELPAIYRRLFRFEAVSDPRFLVGRDREMQAFAEARTLWEAERPVAVLVVGDRGSGKTSLINCALARPLADLDVVRGEFNARVTTADGVRAFLTELLELESPDDIEPTLSMGRRVLILEETERTFLREVGGFDGVRELQRLIAATCQATLWVLVTNQHAFRLLDAALKLGSGFSHRLDAASAAAEAIRQAITVRHNLSGLRLRFVPPPPPRPWVARLHRLTRTEPDPEHLFFSGLARESAGVFRTAFELWLGQIDSVQAGTLVMKPMSRPDIDGVIEQLDQDDLFALLAIMQHGSLTAEEHAAVFRWPRASSGAQLDDLLAREIIEPEPTRPGFRVRPGALRVAREALHRRNLG